MTGARGAAKPAQLIDNSGVRQLQKWVGRVILWDYLGGVCAFVGGEGAEVICAGVFAAVGVGDCGGGVGGVWGSVGGGVKRGGRWKICSQQKRGVYEESNRDSTSDTF